MFPRLSRGVKARSRPQGRFVCACACTLDQHERGQCECSEKHHTRDVHATLGVSVFCLRYPEQRADQTISTIGMLIRNAQRQVKLVVSHPPTTGPTAAIPPMVEPQIAKAMPRSRPVKSALTVENVAGRIIAPPTPCRRRAAINVVPEYDMAAKTLATPKVRMPRISAPTVAQHRMRQRDALLHAATELLVSGGLG